MKLLSAEQMRELDRRTIEEIGLPGAVLMENAGRGAAGQLLEKYAELAPGPVLILAGRGNNGGDGYVMARHLRNAGWQVDVLLLGGRDAVAGDALINLQAWLRSSGSLFEIADAAQLQACLKSLPQPALLVDALFGTGLNAPVRGLAAELIGWMNASGLPVVAVDIPSGIDATSGQLLGIAVQAELTVSFAFAKLGQLLYPGAGHVGELRVVDIGIPRQLGQDLQPAATLVTAELASGLLPVRPLTGHKGSFGHLLIVGGSRGKSGAALLAGGAALRSGAGLVTLAVPGTEQQAMAAHSPELMIEPLTNVDGGLSAAAGNHLRSLAEGKQALVVGPGLGRHPESWELARDLVAQLPVPLVVDADGLNALDGHLEVLLRRSPGTTVLTPHPGEMARLCGVTVAGVEAGRPDVARDFSRQHKVVLVLKGARTLIATPDGGLLVNASGNPLLATGGTGDVLAGMIGSLLAQGLSANDAAVLGVYWHGLAADRLAEQLGDAGMLAGDLLRELPAARAALRSQEENC